MVVAGARRKRRKVDDRPDCLTACLLAAWPGRSSGTRRMNAILREDKDNIIKDSRSRKMSIGGRDYHALYQHVI